MIFVLFAVGLPPRALLDLVGSSVLPNDKRWLGAPASRRIPLQLLQDAKFIRHTGTRNASTIGKSCSLGGPAMRLSRKIILITGGSGGIGSATAVECAKEGAEAIYVTYFGSPERAAAVVKKIDDAGSSGYALKLDVGRKADAVALAKQIGEKWGRIDGVACYAGYPMDKDIWFGDFLSLHEEQLRKPLEVDVAGSLFTAQAVLPFMVEKRRGSIVFVSSTPGLVGDTVGIPYALGKAANANLAKCLAQLYGDRGVRANAIAPGSIGTPANLSALAPKERESLAAEASLRRFGNPEEVAKAAVYLLSEDSSFITGQTLVCDGGTVFR